jgi:predicted dehydrogenase
MPEKKLTQTCPAAVFCKDLLTNPATRSVTDVRHTITAVASSSGTHRASAFLTEAISCPYASSVKTYGTYAALVADSDVDIVYVATPHSHHFQNVMLALEAGKHVLCEKAFTVTQAQVRKLVDKAREKGLFLMEAVWTRYFPLSIKVREMVKDGVIGEVYRVFGELCSFSVPFEIPCFLGGGLQAHELIVFDIS